MSAGNATIFAVSSGSPPAAIGVIRVSGPAAALALQKLTKKQFEPRRSSLAKLRDAGGQILDEALVLWLPGPSNATGEDCVELHCHGGRAVLASVEAALSKIEGLRPAEPGEFTRRAFANGRIDLAEAEGLADLLAAETELQRAAAIANASGSLSRQVEEWRDRVLNASAQIEAALDFSDEDDVDALPDGFTGNIGELAAELDRWLARPRSSRLGAGVRVVLAGPPNAGKSTLFNALVESEAAITSPIAGTTRDVIERGVAISGVPFVFIDTAGLRSDSADAVEVIGIERANAELIKADIVLWLGDEGEGPEYAWEVAPRLDAPEYEPKSGSVYSLSAKTGEGITELKIALVKQARTILPKPGEAALNERQHNILGRVAEVLGAIQNQNDPLLIAEELRRARLGFDQIVGRATTEDMLDALFGRFCIGK
ncbi:tRNA uridine-5-carboxymethylaminomethyl(34) synthesis GTPase MnmE [Erythrobacter sp. YT30]|uniref:tRNA uridine-5-carboxymethylaminomethyl(34) synthesis GTPase MnmE n=1 Tax=Erythrobacter sp. YT30 TaxID=1735012 RepID=UPI00076C2AFE|nr:tRNA uridine-5-carboxymethylaminomethyl(34) synthesis GTPase MnmE [Erythrobacter sp. YT30]KWV91408.1 tRNA modification GTPase TrmE [Erythrobacter sp. YT30]